MNKKIWDSPKLTSLGNKDVASGGAGTAFLEYVAFTSGSDFANGICASPAGNVTYINVFTAYPSVANSVIAGEDRINDCAAAAGVGTAELCGMFPNGNMCS